MIDFSQPFREDPAWEAYRAPPANAEEILQKAFQEWRRTYLAAGAAYVRSLVKGDAAVVHHAEEWLRERMDEDPEHAAQALYFFRKGADDAARRVDWTTGSIPHTHSLGDPHHG